MQAHQRAERAAAAVPAAAQGSLDGGPAGPLAAGGTTARSGADAPRAHADVASDSSDDGAPGGLQHATDAHAEQAIAKEEAVKLHGTGADAESAEDACPDGRGSEGADSDDGHTDSGSESSDWGTGDAAASFPGGKLFESSVALVTADFAMQVHTLPMLKCPGPVRSVCMSSLHVLPTQSLTQWPHQHSGLAHPLPDLSCTSSQERAGTVPPCAP